MIKLQHFKYLKIEVTTMLLLRWGKPNGQSGVVSDHRPRMRDAPKPPSAVGDINPSLSSICPPSYPAIWNQGEPMAHLFLFCLFFVKSFLFPTPIGGVRKQLVSFLKKFPRALGLTTYNQYLFRKKFPGN